jgi:hypothetical protein
VALLRNEFCASAEPLAPCPTLRQRAGSPTHALCLREIVIEVSARGCHLGHEDLSAHPPCRGSRGDAGNRCKSLPGPATLRLQERTKYLRPSLFELDILLEPEL